MSKRLVWMLVSTCAIIAVLTVGSLLAAPGSIRGGGRRPLPSVRLPNEAPPKVAARSNFGDVINIGAESIVAVPYELGGSVDV
jgi:hypothetical protein